MRAIAIALGVIALAAPACGGASSARFNADPQHDLLTLDQMESPGFTVESPPASKSAADLAAGDQTGLDRLDTDGFAAAASVGYARTVDFATSNGPIAVVDTVERFNNEVGAHSSYAGDIADRDRLQGEVAVSTGPLGDEAHADSLVMTAPDGIQAVQITLEWRVDNVIVVLQVRGRYGGARLDDALLLAHKQTSTQLAA
ncbi:MAG: hypothetical protein ABR498_05430 [Candidatus Dormibacteria bacterium]